MGTSDARPRHRPVWRASSGRARPYHSSSGAAPSRLLAARAGGAATLRSRTDMKPEPRPLTVLHLLAMKAAGRRIVMLTCYDAVFARLLEQAEVDVLLVGD